MRRTYAYNGVIFGTLAGLAVLGLTENMVLTIIAFVAVSVLAFAIIRGLENLVYKGASKAQEKISDAYARRKEEKARQKGSGDQ